MLVKCFAKYMRGAREGVIGVAIGQREPGNKVIRKIGMGRRGAVIQCREVIGRDGQVRIVDEDQLCCILCDIGGFRDHAGDGFTHIAHFAIGKGRRAGRQFQRAGGLFHRHDSVGQMGAEVIQRIDRDHAIDGEGRRTVDG